MSWFPFVSRARFEELRERLQEKQKELSELQLQHMRVVDEINFRSTGFHLYPQFAKSEEQAEATRRRAVVDPLNEQPEQPEEIVSSRVRNRLQSIEQRNFTDFAANRKKESSLVEASKQKAANALEEALTEGDQLAEQA